jgi:hypothetical protein
MRWQWKEQMDACYRCCATWGETVIRVECNERKGNGTGVKEGETKKKEEEGEGKEKDRGRELGFS